MSKCPLVEQHGLYYNEAQGIPRRSSATATDLHESHTRTSVHMPTQSSDEDADTRTSVRDNGKSVLRHRPIGTLYAIPLTDGSELRVTEHELADLPEDYQTAAQRVTPQIAAPRPRRQPHPKVPAQDETVYEMPPARTHRPRTDALPEAKQRRHAPRFHWLWWVGLSMLIMVVASSSSMWSLSGGRSPTMIGSMADRARFNWMSLSGMVPHSTHRAILSPSISTVILR